MMPTAATGSAVLVALLLSVGVQGQEDRFEDFLISPTDTPSLNRQLGAVMAADDRYLAFGLKDPADGFDGGTLVFMARTTPGDSWVEMDSVSGPADGGEDVAAVLAMDDGSLVATSTGFGSLPEVTVYHHSDATDDWTSQVETLARPISATAQFGSSLDIDGDLVAVGDPGANRVFVYLLGPDGNDLIDTVLPQSAMPESFGLSVAVYGDWLAVGDPGDGTGRVEIHRLSTGGGSSFHKVLEGDPGELVEGDRFGSVVSMDEGALAVGIERVGFTPGRIKIYNLVEFEGGETWYLFHQADAVDGLQRFPRSIDVEAGVVIAGAPGALLGSDSGAAMVFRFSGNTWTNSENFRLFGDDSGFQMGDAVALCGTQALVGVPNRDLGGFPPQLAGGIASFDMDCDNDGVADALEITLGLEADYDQDGVPDFCELDEFILVPLDYPTIQSAIDLGGGRVILLEPGTFSEEVVANGIDVDIRAFDPQDLPVWRTSFAAGTAITASVGNLHVEGILFDGNRIALDAAFANVTAIDCSFTANGYGMKLDDVDLEATSCRFEGNISIGEGGSAIHADRALLVLDSCAFIDNGGNSTTGFHYGGAIRVEDGPGNGIRATECAFTGNQALVRHAELPAATQGFAVGGAVYAGLLEVPSFFSRCAFSDNLVDASLQRLPGGFSAPNSASSGALDVEVDGLDLGIIECTFDRNESRALDTLGGNGFSRSSALHVDASFGGSVDFIDCTVRDSNCTVAYLDGSLAERSRASADSVTFYSLEEASIVGSRFERSGHLYCSGIGLVDMFVGMSSSEFIDSGRVNLEKPSNAVNCTFTGTSLKIRGDVISSTFEGITAEFSSALWMNGDSPVLVNSDFHRVAGASVVGGGTEIAPINVSGTTICGNSAVPFASDLTWSDAGGNLIEGGPNGTAPCPAGGTITVPGGQPTIEAALLAANNDDTILLGPGLFMESIDARGFGALTIAGSGSMLTSIDPPAGEAGVLVHGGTVTLRELTISGASTGVSAHSGTIWISDVVLENNSGDCGAGIRLESGFEGVDGDGAVAYLQDTTLRNNSAAGDGGGICVESDAALIVQSSSFDTNTAGGSGGGLYIADGARTVTIANTAIDFNIASESGGGVHAGNAALLELVEVDLAGNSAGTYGGGVRVEAAELTDCDFTGNTAGEVGGGMRSDGTSVLTDCTFQLNIAGVGGGLAATAIPSFVDGFSACGNVGGDWYGDLRAVEGDALFCSSDCNNNGVADADEIAGGLLEDCNGNEVPDVCEDLPDVDGNGIPDECDPSSGQEVLMAVLDVVGGLPAGAVDVLARPLFRDGSSTHDMLVLDPVGDGSIVRVRPDGAGGYDLGSTLPGAGFERCCVTPFDAEVLCINNGPSGGASLAMARGDVLISHPDGDTGLFDEDLEMYYACNAPAGAGLPSPITDYDLAPETNLLVAVEYVEEEEGLARAMPSRQGQVLLAAPTASTGSKPSSSRRGSGQGGTGPYPGEDEQNDYGLSIRSLSVGTFDDDRNDDLVTLHPDENSFSIRTFTGIADFIDPDTGELVPSGATWSEPTFVSTTDPGLGMVVGSFVDFAGTADDGLDDVAVVVDAPAGPVLRVWASVGAGTMARVGTDYALLGDNFSLGRTRIDSAGLEAVLLAQQGSGGLAYLDHAVFDSESLDLQYGWIGLGSGAVRAVSNAPVRFGVSDREVVAVLLDLGASTSVALVEMSKRPGHVPPANDDCQSPQVVSRGSVPFTTLGATTGGSELPADCESDESRQVRNDVWFSWTASCSGEVEVSTCGSADFDTWLVAYTGGCEGTVVACNDENDACPGSTSAMTLDAIEGETYLIRVGSWSASGRGSGTLGITCGGTPSDINGDGIVDGADLTQLLGNWGQPGATDLNQDGLTDGADLATLLGDWGS
jgi:predicted outer membrane repeat protein